MDNWAGANNVSGPGCAQQHQALMSRPLLVQFKSHELVGALLIGNEYGCAGAAVAFEVFEVPVVKVNGVAQAQTEAAPVSQLDGNPRRYAVLLLHTDDLRLHADRFWPGRTLGLCENSRAATGRYEHYESR